MKNKLMNLPVSYSLLEFDSERFLKLRVKVMHSGLNENRSNFGVEAINSAEPTLKNIPLLAFIKRQDGADDADFGGHEYEIRITENDIKYVYLGRPVGMIPETNNYSLVKEDDKYYVYVDAYVWKDYANEALDIIDRDFSKSVSMEVNIDDYESRDDYLDILSYKYTGIALLGDDVRPAMLGAKAEIAAFSADSIQSMISELNEALQKEPGAFSAEDGKIVADNAQVDVGQSGGSTIIMNPDGITISFGNEGENNEEDKKFEEELKEDNEKRDEGEYKENEQPEGEEEEQGEVEEDEFNLEKDTDETDPEEDKEAGSKNFIIEAGDKRIYIDRKNNKFYQSTETESGPIYDEIFPVWRTQGDVESHEQLLEDFSKLTQFKEKIEQAEKKKAIADLLSDFSDLPKEWIEELLEKDLELEDLKLHLFALRGQMVSKPKTGKVYLNGAFESNYDIPKINQVDYADIVKKHKNKEEL